MSSQIDEPDAQSLLTHKLGCDLGDQHLAAVGRAHDPRCTVNRWAEEAALTLGRGAGVQPHPGAQVDRVRPWL
jgi:hypothetical protein